MLLVTSSARAGLVDTQHQLLQKFVSDDGRVDYAALKADPTLLDRAVSDIAMLDSAVYASWGEKERLAFWLNAYNTLTLKLIVDHYPIQPASGRQRYPANSIQQIPGAWERPVFTVMGTARSLDDIEHKIVRVEFHEPRVHMALVCAALSCPPLRREAYTGDALDAQLDDQGRRFFSDLRNFMIDRKNNAVYVSRILQWFADDIIPGVIEQNERFVGERKAMLAFVPQYVAGEDRRFLETGDYKLEYFDYDWTLNEQMK
ncbi:MAG TPA: DUF547 domain-containing protein [Candidatus Krumholzibacteria bacterium]|nr:DUF547 domain-containing protein [Candidatus Krumholzibacteria bacterium]